MEEKVNIKLSEFQQWMQQLLLDPFQQTETDPFSFLPGSANLSSLEDIIVHSEKLSAQEHLKIYQRSYILRLRNCMAQQFSALEYALGEDIFCSFADDYLASHPSTNYNLALLGENFAAYLQANRPDALSNEKEDWIDFMLELAEFEYALGVIFEKQAEEEYELANENSLDENLTLVPICELFKFQFPVQWFYSEFKNENQPNLPFASETYTLVLRHHYKLSVFDLKEEQYEFLTLLKTGITLSDAKFKLREKYGVNEVEFEHIWAIWKKNWIAAKVFRIATR